MHEKMTRANIHMAVNNTERPAIGDTVEYIPICFSVRIRTISVSVAWMADIVCYSVDKKKITEREACRETRT